jgi:hypothetical protein
MRPSFAGLPAAFSLLATLAGGAGCQPLCSDDLSQGSAYRATVVGPYGSGTRFPGSLPFRPGNEASCQEFDGLNEGTSVTITATDTTPGRSCDTLTGRIDSAPASVTLEKPGRVLSSASFLSGAAVVSTGGCRGLWTIELVNPIEATGGVFDDPVEGQTPPVVMLREFGPETATDKCRQCWDFLAVKFQKQ